jgi:tripartite ATP-independent transporter DctM subunit
MPAGLAIVVVLTCAFFTTFTGASGVTIIALGGLLMPALVQENYPEDFSLGLVTSSGSIGLLFPPSLPIILYGIVAGTDIEKLFVAGVLPGALMIGIISLWSIKVATKAGVVRTPFVATEAWAAIWETKWELAVPVVILVGIYGGFVTIGEASAITAGYLLIIEVFVYKDLSMTKDIPRIIREAMILVGAILVILGVALGLTNYMIDAEIPQKIFEVIRQYITEKWMFLLALNLFLLVVGCLMDIFSAIIVVVPLITPIAREFNIDPIHLGIIFLANLEIGYLTPPVGINLFISTLAFKKPLTQIYRTALPFLGLLVIALLIITYVPALSLGLLQMMGKG